MLGSSPEDLASGTLRQSATLEAHVTHALNVVIVQLQNVETMMADADPQRASRELEVLHALVMRLREQASPHEARSGEPNDRPA